MYKTTCQCKSLTITVNCEPTDTAICYCNHCRQNSGYYCQIGSKVPMNQLDIDDPVHSLKEFEFNDTQSGQPKYKAFCTGCGMTIYTRRMDLGGNIAYVRMSIFDNYIPNITQTVFSQFKPDFINN